MRIELQTDLRPQVINVDVPLGIAFHHHHLHAGQHGRGRVGAVCRHGDDTDVAVLVSTATVVTSDGQETGVLAL